MPAEKYLRIVLATRNAGKVRELAEPLASFGVEVLGLEAFPLMPDVEETGVTFEENALLKARATAAFTKCISVADDSGLEVDALHNAPGVYSARYADDLPPLEGESRDARNIRKLLAVLAQTPESARGCRFVCCMAAVAPNNAEIVQRGTWEGRLLTAPRGGNGFGYDPIFFDPLINKAAAELSKDEKNLRSHRGNALRGLLAQWPAFMAQLSAA